MAPIFQDAVCINLVHRKDRKKAMQKQAKRRKMDIRFFPAKLHDTPARGCLESHLTVIREAVERGTQHLLIIEDDAQFTTHPYKLPTPPGDWAMLYLGGTVKEVKGPLLPGWVQMSCWTTHAYIINLSNAEFVADVLGMEEYTQEIDRFYIENIHSKWPCYMINPMAAVQSAGYSDIEGAEVKYDFMPDTLNTLAEPEHEITEEGAYILTMPELPDPAPPISIITPTYNRRHLFTIALRNWESINYPRDKLEWVIVDDSSDPAQCVEDLLPTDSRIRYIRLQGSNKPQSIAAKRNLAVEKASHDIIVHMDDDDLYPPDSVPTRVRALLAYGPKIRCVGCCKIGIYDLMANVSSLSSDGSLTLSEASMAYTRSFWEDQDFNESERVGEYRSFLHGRCEQVMNLPYTYVIFALTHGGNYTQKLRESGENLLRDKDSGESTNFFDYWSSDLQLFLTDLRAYLLRRKAPTTPSATS